MCGRYGINLTATELAALFGTQNALPNIPANYNAAPTQTLPVVHIEKEARILGQYRWGLIPFWAKDISIGNKAINARAEEIEQKPMFREAFARRRCLVPANLFYEWKGEKGRKQPFAISMRDDTPFAFAGLWESWQDPSSKEHIRSFTILTCDANPLLAPIHHRMPVIVPKAEWPLWLGEKQASLSELKHLLVSFPSEAMKWWKVSPRVSNVSHNESELWLPEDETANN